MKKAILLLLILIFSLIAAAREQGEIDVIIKFKDPAQLRARLSAIEHKSLIRASQKTALSRYDIEVRRNFSLVNSVAAKVDQRTYNRLLRDPNVEQVYLDQTVQAFLPESVPLIDAPDFWAVDLQGFGINGTGETVCIIDTGIDYDHPALGNCSPQNYATEGNTDAFFVESPHPYGISQTYTYKVNQTGYTKISIHFVNISTEANYDFVQILEADNDTVIASYSGSHENLWSPPVEGDTLYVRLFSDELIPGEGFIINMTINGTVSTSLDWSSCDKVLAGWDFVNSDEDPADDHNHGTHVSGIVASTDPTNTGVAPGSRIVSMKSLGSNGVGTFSDIDAGIEWCVDNAEKYNISVISMSLGAGNYTTACDNLFPATSNLVRLANDKGIAVIAASGNNYNKGNISAPACLENITSVGASTDADTIIAFSQSDEILDLLAPGSTIYSTNIGGGFITKSGTSMAAPHVAGAFLLLRSFKRHENGTILGPLQLRDILAATGINLTDSNGIAKPRINLSKALESIDENPKALNVSPQNNTFTAQSNMTVMFTQSEPLANASIFTDDAYDIAGDGIFGYNLSLDEGQNNFTLILKDRTGNIAAFGPYIIFSDTEPPEISYSSPTPGNWSGSNNAAVIVNATVSDESGISSCWLEWNSTDNSTMQQTQTGCIANKSLSATGIYSYRVFANDTAGRVSMAGTQYINISNAPPTLAVIEDVVVNESDLIQIEANATDPDNSTLTYGISDPRFSQDSGNFSWQTTMMDSGAYNVTINVSDNFLTVERSFMVTVLEIEDSDNDGLNDSVDYLSGNASDIDSTISLNLTVNSSANLSQPFNATLPVAIKNGSDILADFNWSFAINSTLNLSSLKIRKQSSGPGFILIEGLNTSQKVLYMDDIDSAIDTICIKDAQVDDISQVSASCDGVSEVLVGCNDTPQSGYTCTDLGARYRITGLMHSAAIEQCADSDADGYYAEGCGSGDDCNDANPLINPGRGEVCGNSQDDDCDGSIDEGCSGGSSGGSSRGGGGPSYNLSAIETAADITAPNETITASYVNVSGLALIGLQFPGPIDNVTYGMVSGRAGDVFEVFYVNAEEIPVMEFEIPVEWFAKYDNVFLEDSDGSRTILTETSRDDIRVLLSAQPSSLGSLSIVGYREEVPAHVEVPAPIPEKERSPLLYLLLFYLLSAGLVLTFIAFKAITEKPEGRVTKSNQKKTNNNQKSI